MSSHKAPQFSEAELGDFSQRLTGAQSALATLLATSASGASHAELEAALESAEAQIFSLRCQWRSLLDLPPPRRAANKSSNPHK